LSNHVQKRLQDRQIALSDDGLTRLARAVDKAERRGCRDSLVLVDDLAFIVNVRQRVVVTAMDARSRGEGVFTQIDSVVLADDREYGVPNPIRPPTAAGPLGGGLSVQPQEALS
jgi:flagellar operon protein